MTLDAAVNFEAYVKACVCDHAPGANVDGSPLLASQASPTGAEILPGHLLALQEDEKEACKKQQEEQKSDEGLHLWHPE